MTQTSDMPLASVNCWRQIGVAGDATCPELRQVLHCRNCPVYTAAGRRLLERAMPETYRQEWTDALAQEKDVSTGSTTSVLIFRLGMEWLALPTEVCQEVSDRRVIRRLPHRSGAILLGLVNIHGELRLCVSLSGLLGLTQDTEAEQQTS